MFLYSSLFLVFPELRLIYNFLCPSSLYAGDSTQAGGGGAFAPLNQPLKLPKFRPCASRSVVKQLRVVTLQEYLHPLVDLIQDFGPKEAVPNEILIVFSLKEVNMESPCCHCLD